MQRRRVFTCIARKRIALWGHGADDVGNAMVQQRPEYNQLFLWNLLIALQGNPLILIVNNIGGKALVLSADKPAQVVMSRITEVTEYFLFTPLRREGFMRKIVLGNLAEAIRKGMNKLKQLGCYSVQGYFFSVTRSRLKSS